MRSIRLDLLSPKLQRMVKAEYHRAIKRPDHLMTYEECSMLYGYTLLSLRTLVWSGKLEVQHHGQRVLITHAAMRDYIRSRQKTGRPRKQMIQQQLEIE